MQVEFRFDMDKIAQRGYTKDAVYRTITKNFAAKKLRCTASQDVLAFEDNGAPDDFSNMWAIIMALLRTDWFVQFATSCMWYEDDGTAEDILSQAWKVRRQKMA